MNEIDYLDLKIKRGIFKAQAQMSDKYNKKTLAQLDGLISGNAHKFERELDESIQRIEDKKQAIKDQEKARSEAEGGKPEKKKKKKKKAA